VVSRLKAEDGAEKGDESPKKKKRKVVSKETIESEVESESEAEAEDANVRFVAEWVQSLGEITKELRLMRKAQEKVASECVNIAKGVAYLVTDMDLIVEGKRYVRTRSHGPVTGEEESPSAFGAEEAKTEAEKAKGAADEDATMKE
jgi:hypothetical protein